MAAAEKLKLIAEPAVLDAIGEWRRWLADEKRSSGHTIDAYQRDITAFLNFLCQHLGHPPGIPDLARPARYRSAGRERFPQLSGGTGLPESGPDLNRPGNVDAARIFPFHGETRHR